MSRSCPDCGAGLDEAERFCGECGAYVDWSGDPAADAGPAAEPETVPAGAGSAGGAPGPGSAVPTGPPPSSPPPPPRPGSRPTARVEVPKVSTAERPAEDPAPGDVPPGAPEGDPPAPPPRPGADWQPPPPPDALKAMVVPVSDAPAGRKPGAPQQPAPQKPGAAAPKAKRPRPPADDPIQHGDLVCGQCGIGNKPTRKFCRRCGNNLAEAEVAKIGWWRRWRTKRKVKEAGTRPKSRRSGRSLRPRVPMRLMAVLILLGTFGIGGYALRDVLGGGYETVRDRISGVEQVRSETGVATATSAQRGHGAPEVIDTITNEWWAPAKAGDGRGEKINIEFSEPMRLVYVLIFPGISAEDEEAFTTQGRPREMNVVLRREDGTSAVKKIELDDEVGQQKFGIGVNDVVEVTFEIRRSYAGTAPDSRVAIGEMEFYKRK